MLWPRQQGNGQEVQWNIAIALCDAPIVDEFAPLLPEDEEIVQRVHQKLIQDMDLSAVEKLGPARGREAVEQGVRTLVVDAAPQLYGERKEMVIRRVIDDAIGLGPLEPLLLDK